jgi:hypothetical protein
MKNMLLICFLLTIGWVNNAEAQINTSQLRSINKQVQQVNNVAKNVGSGVLLSNLDTQLKQKFRLDGVKSELTGETLKVKAASAAFARLPVASQNAHGKRILDGAVMLLSDRQGLPIKTVVVELVKDITLANAISSFSRQLK